MKLTKKVYEHESNKFIKNYKVEKTKVIRPGTLFRKELLHTDYVKNKRVGERVWNDKFPDGYKSWTKYHNPPRPKFHVGDVVVVREQPGVFFEDTIRYSEYHYMTGWIYKFEQLQLPAHEDNIKPIRK